MSEQNWNFPWVAKAGTRKQPAVHRTFHTADFGARGDAITDDTMSIQRALDAAEAGGGGVVTFSPGMFLTGSLFIGNNTHFHLPKGTVLLGSQKIDDYRTIATRVAGIETEWPAALLNVIDKKNVLISGTGIIDGRGKVFWDDFWERTDRDYIPNSLRWAADYDCRRPRGILVQNCEDITVREVVILRAGFWSLQLLYSQHLTVEDICIANNIEGYGPSTDGIDVDSSEYVLIQRCTIDCNDDNICLKAGRDADGLRVNRKTEYVVIRTCSAGRGCGLVTFGSETSGFIRNVLIEDVCARNTHAGLLFKSAMIRGGGVEHIFARNIEMERVDFGISFNMNWFPAYSCPKLPSAFQKAELPELWRKLTAPVDRLRGIPKISDINIENLSATNIRDACIDVNSFPEIPIRNVTIRNASFEGKRAGNRENTIDWLLENVSIKLPTR